MRAASGIAKRLLRTKEAAHYVGMSPGKLRRLTQSGELPIIQHDEHSPWLYDLHDLDDFIEKSKHRLSDLP
jgi:excisionase family DNA binding protein